MSQIKSNENTIFAFRPSTKVLLGHDFKIEGLIIGFSYRNNRILYEVTWWDATHRRSEWLGEEEFILKPKEKVKKISIGFKDHGDSKNEV